MEILELCTDAVYRASTFFQITTSLKEAGIRPLGFHTLRKGDHEEKRDQLASVYPIEAKEPMKIKKFIKRSGDSPAEMFLPKA